ncbi:MAG: copper resistance CopC/CopD family protein [Gemmatimonadaceae bacterium]
MRSNRRLLLVTLSLLLTPAVLLAHARLLRSTPAAGAHLSSSPRDIRLVFSEAPMAPVSRVFLIGPGSDTVRLSTLRTDSADRHALVAEVPSVLDSGKYTLNWSTAASDGHASNGAFTFTVVTRAKGVAGRATTGPTVVAPVQTKTVKFRSRINNAVQFALGAPMWMARWAGFIALFFLIGAVSFRYVILGRIPTAQRETDEVFQQIALTGAATTGLSAGMIMVVTSLLKLYGETVAMPGVPASTMLFSTSWGWAWVAQISACLLAIIAFALAHNRARHSESWALAAISALTLAVTPALTGHAIGSDQAFITVPLDIVHVLAGSAWLGTLALILFVGIGSAAKTPGDISIGTRVATLVNAFSPLALFCGAAVVATGVAASLIHVQPISRLWKTTYGMTLIVKLALVSLLFSLGAWNWRRVKPNLGGDEGVIALRFSAKLELSASVLVLAVTAFLVALPLPD